jgi:hypothetical protein
LSCADAATTIAVCRRSLSSLHRRAFMCLALVAVGPDVPAVSTRSCRGEASAHRDARARTNLSRRCRASNIVISSARLGAACRLSSKTERTISATRPGGTLPSSSADSVAVISADPCLLSLAK